ncbi:ABC transporter D family member 1-like isoform X2 [Mangifera indica]|uniref:ABC transporter D family member 1-like isoform X2 n=1 Tax=Mangifera indica TaxID=29780 RepID=UPI001CF9ED0A|nr:ABC transporter D family member 1-like isoform X2 [Mangifera indica]
MQFWYMPDILASKSKRKQLRQLIFIVWRSAPLAMPSLQLLQLTKHGQSVISSRRKALLLASGILVAGGTAAYLQSRFSHRKPDSFAQYNGVEDNEAKPGKGAKDGINQKKSKAKKGGSKSLKVLAAILLSEMGQLGARDLLALVGIVVLRTALSNRLAKVQGFLFRAAFLRRVPLFFRLISENILLCFLLSTMHSTSKFITGTLSLRFRKILTKLIHSRYFENMAYYKISHVDRRITNPEQRIASDVPKFCSELSELVQDDLIAVTDALLYTWRLCSYASPKYFFWMVAYVLGAGGMIRNFSPAFGKLMSKEQQLGGEYRQLHSRLRTHAESIAFYGGENREDSNIQKKFKSLTRHMSTVLHEHWWFGMIQDFLLKYLGATVAVVLIIEPFFAGHLRPESSTLGRAEMLSNLRYHTSVIISLFHSLGTLATSSRKLNRLSGYADRIHELVVLSRELSIDDKSSSQRNGSRNYFSEANYIEFSGVKVVTPTGNVLVEDLTLKVEPGSNLLITGPNGSGKSSLFRVLGGLWPLVSGHIAKPGVGSDLNKEIFYVPQRPYTAVGTLRDQLIYPLTAKQEVEPLTHSGMVELLKNVDLEYLLDRYPPEKEVNWGDELSLGEQQRLGMARLFYHKPKFAILDECTSAVTTDMEKRFCAKVRAMGTSCITISHRPALVAFHDVVLSLDGEGEWRVHYRRDDAPVITNSVINMSKSSETDRQTSAMAVEQAFVMAKKDSTFSNSKTQSYISEVIAKSSSVDHSVSLPSFPQLRSPSRGLPLRVAAMSKVLVPTVLDKQGAQLLAVAFLVLSRTWISDRIASLNGTTVKYVLEQDKASFVRLIGVSILQSAASSFIAPSLRYLTGRLALRWRIRMTQHLLKNYLRNNAFYKVFNMSSKSIDADQRITQDLEKLTSDLAGLVTGMVKPSVDILWFTWRMKLLTGQRGVAILYVYMFLGLGFLRTVTPDFGDLTGREQQLEGTFRFMHERLRTHAESIAFFGGGSREKDMIDSRFRELLNHSLLLLKKKWLFGILDDFVTKQLPNNVTWGLSLLYALEHKGDRALTSTQGELAHALRFLASVVSQSFLAFGDILELHRKFLELSGGINRIFELEELLYAAQSEVDGTNSHSQHNFHSEDAISFSELDIITPAQKMLARQLTYDVVPGKSLLVTGPNGSGKSSIFRVLRGLWPVVSGSLAKPSQHIIEEGRSGCGIFYVPQRPYTCLGTLRDQIIYPLSHEEAKRRALRLHGEVDSTNILDAYLKCILENVRLSYLLERVEVGWDADLNWEDTLSLGEQQRLGMARLFFHRPKLGILDECTNATSVEIEEQLYRLAQDMGITFVTSSQRPALIPFHSMELRLIDGEGNWELRTIKQ